MNEPDPRDMLGRAVALHRAGTLDEAEALYRAVAQQSPGDFDAQHLLGILRLQRGDAAMALGCFERALAIDPRSVRAQHNRGRALEALNRPDAALAAYDAALAIEPSNPEILNDRGLALRQQDRLGEALASFERALESQPDFLPALGNRALVLMRLDRSAAALDGFERLLALAPDHVEGLVNRARLLQSFGDGAAVIDAYRRVLSLRPGLVAAEGALADALAGLGRNEEAAALARGILARATANNDRDRFLALRTLASMPHPPADLDLVAALEAMQAPSSLAPQQFKTMRDFALAGLRHKRGEYDATWRYLEAAHRPLRETARAQRDARRQSYAAALAAVDAASELDDAIPPRADLPVSLFILGPSRSGKTIVERLVATIPGVHAGGENALARIARERAADGSDLATLTQDQRARFADEYARLLARAGEARIVTGTAPGNIRDIVPLAGLVPNLRLVFLKRARNDLLLRIAMKQYTGNDYAGDPASIAAYLDFYDGMIDRLAARFPRHALLLHYEDVVADPDAARSAIAQLCGVAAPTGSAPKLPDDRNCAAPYAALIAAALSGNQA
ncbi:MAG: tetratricopeptide repeat protein [Rhodospirillaceae bacterium]|nr:tetratricopeptide repeat protein [Rhodospirillaceae bacterium]